MILHHLSLHVFGHFVVEPHVFPLGFEVLEFSVSADEAIEAGCYVGLDQLLAGVDVQRGDEPRMLLEEILLVVAAKTKQENWS